MFCAPPDDIKIRKTFRSIDVEKYKNKRIFLSANAGAGKTSEIFKFIKNHKKYSFCLISYTKHVTEDFKKRMKNDLGKDYKNEYDVTVMTYDSLCKRNRNDIYKEEKPWNTMNYYSTTTAERIYGDCFKDDDTFTHIERYRHGREPLETYILNTPGALDQLKDYCLERKVAQNVHVNRLLILADYKYFKYDIIIIDEAQDLSMLQRTFIKRNRHLYKLCVFVGDLKQMIYNNSSVFDTITDEDKIYELTHTFRYGSDVIVLLNKGHTKAYHTSFLTTKTIIEHCTFNEYIQSHGKICILISSWKNILKYTELIKNRSMKLNAKSKNKIKNEIQFHKEYVKLYNIWTLSFRHITEQAFFRSRGKEGLMDYSDNKWEDLESILKYIEEIEAKEKKEKKRKRKSQIEIVTIHSTKGLEYDHVYLDDSCFPEYNTNPCSFRIKDNLFYTACTRACRSLGYNKKNEYVLYSFTRAAEEISHINKEITQEIIDEYIKYYGLQNFNNFKRQMWAIHLKDKKL